MEGNKSLFTTTQFLIVILINLIPIGVWMNHFLHQQVRVEVKKEVKEKVIEKEKTVEKCTATQNAVELLKTAGEVCEDQMADLKGFKIDGKGNPNFSCE